MSATRLIGRGSNDLEGPTECINSNQDRGTDDELADDVDDGKEKRC